MKKIAYFLFCTLFLAACGNETKQIETLTKETETIHDEAMKTLADMNRVARELKEFMISATMTPEQSAAYMDVLSKMGKAENEMMDWMKNYKAPDQMPSAEAISYLKTQKALIEKNHADLKSALEAGMKLQGK